MNSYLIETNNVIKILSEKARTIIKIKGLSELETF